jgi:protein PhnA
MSNCQLCDSPNDLGDYEVAHMDDATIVVCNTCRSQIEDPDTMDVHHWRCLNDSMWSTEAPVQVMAWRLLSRLSKKGETWAQDALDMLYLDDAVLASAQAGETSGDADDDAVKHVDSNGAALEAGDTVTLIKDLNVKGGGFTAKRGTAVRNISLVHDNPEHIEGRVNGQQIVILTKFVKKN